MAKDTLESFDPFKAAKQIAHHREQAVFHKEYGTHADFRSHRYLGSQLELRIRRHANRLMRHLHTQGAHRG